MNFSRQSWEEYKILYPARYGSRNIEAQFQLQINNYNYAKLLERDEILAKKMKSTTSRFVEWYIKL